MLMEKPNSGIRNVFSDDNHPFGGRQCRTVRWLEFQQKGEGNSLPVTSSSVGGEPHNQGN
jgi:hypothetical protein